MKKSVIILGTVLMLSSCMSEYCATYSGTRRKGEMVIASKKQKEVRDKTPYYKVVKRAEID